MTGIIQVLKDDWNLHKHSDRRPLFALWSYRFGRFAWNIKFMPLRKLLGIIYLITRPIMQLIGGIYIDRAMTLGSNPHFIHAGNVQLNPESVIGNNVGIMHGVTLGSSPEKDGAPTLGDNVFLGVHCSVIGKVNIGNNVTIAANTLVISNVPDNSMVIGVPGKILPKSVFPKK